VALEEFADVRDRVFRSFCGDFFAFEDVAVRCSDGADELGPARFDSAEEHVV